jgi:hypothetical protein
MKSHDLDREWKKDAPTLAGMQRHNPFTVPLAYFESLSKKMHSNKIIESARFKNEQEFPIPGNYFNELSHRIESKIALENIIEIQPSIGFSLPKDYFYELSHKIEGKIKLQTELKKKKTLAFWISYSAAACITMIIGSVIYFNINTHDINRDLSNISDQEIINYLKIYSTVGDNQYIIDNLSADGLQQVSNDIDLEDIEQYINNTML